MTRKKKSKRIKIGIEQRDNAIKMGADGLTTLIKTKYKRFIIPGLEHWIVPKAIENLFSNCSGGDVLLIGSAKSKKLGELASCSSALEILC